MGGSGRAHISHHEVSQRTNEARQRLDDEKNDALINAFRREVLVAINDRDIDLVNLRLDEIEEAFEDEIDFYRVLFGGSISKHTYVDGMSDIDALVVLRDASLDPDEAKKSIHDAIANQASSRDISEIRIGKLAVTIEYGDGSEIQLLPAIEARGKLSISSPDGQAWDDIEPRLFTSRLTSINQRQNNMVVPTIKLAKVILNSELRDNAPGGYHVEALAVRAFQDYTGRHTPKRMLIHQFNSASQDVLTRVQDVTGQSRYVDASLGNPYSAARANLSRELSSLAERLSTQPISRWRTSFE